MWLQLTDEVDEPSPNSTQALPFLVKPPEEAIPPEEDTRENEFEVGDDSSQEPDGRIKRERKEMNFKEPRIYKC